MTNNSRYIDNRIETPQEFASVFSHFYFAENKSIHAIHKTLFPSFHTLLIFSFHTGVLLRTKQNHQIALEKCLLLGPIKQAFDYSLPPNSDLFVVNFKDDAFYRFFGAINIDKNTQLPTGKPIFNQCFIDMWHKLKQMNDVNARIDFILDYCRPFLDKRSLIADQLLSVKDELKEPIKTVAHLRKVSERTVQAQHKKQFAYTAKENNRYQRFLKAIKIIQNISFNNCAIDWFDVISDCGYYDQSHLIHDFKYYLCLTPSQYLQFHQDICNPLG
ncbi:helix-turn-helix domain-containing protein [Colwellia sp. MSW7]|jgi:AraC-like DNA-binding protein|uniref:Helix-turn-helix domain-containing protein n=1 Tax=Colwellia maritima TaxID=2912588 RepID=A0ABS9WXT1_9GAMM|nr:helix-turn-helix domain-containing protein [Colwellia maritima]MCI2282684.1 helix-turn-helix domain-containing protein [Colwellia maritima]